MQCIFTAGQVAAVCRVGLEQRSTYLLHQQQKPKSSGRDWVNTVKDTHYPPRGPLGGRYTCSLLCLCRAGNTTSVGPSHLWIKTYNIQWMVQDIHKENNTSIYTHTLTLILLFRSSVVHSPGWCHWAVLVVAKTVWSYSLWSWSGAWWELWRVLYGTERE